MAALSVIIKKTEDRLSDSSAENQNPFYLVFLNDIHTSYETEYDGQKQIKKISIQQLKEKAGC